MITGRVTAAREAVLPLQVYGHAGRTVLVEAVIDTGFTGFLTLPTTLVTQLGLPFAGTTRATLSDGREVAIDVFEATVLWDGHSRPVTVLAAEGGALVGMAMLFGFRLTLDGVIGGLVRLEALPSSGSL
jgi:clan AA aspartic protease